MNSSIQRAIDHSQGAAPLARRLGVSLQAVCFWRDNRRKVPLDQCPFIEEATDGLVRCEELRPDKLQFFELVHRQARARDRAE